MEEFIVKYLPYLLSVNFVISMILAGNGKKFGWLYALLNQILWLIWIILSQSWGLLPMNIALWFVYGRNYLKNSKSS